MIDPKFQAYPADDPGLTDAEYAAAMAKWNKEFVDWLGDVGRRLWDLLPEQFRDEYLRLQESDYPPRSILIHSDEMIFPWELVKPSVCCEWLPAICAARCRSRAGALAARSSAPARAAEYGCAKVCPDESGL